MSNPTDSDRVIHDLDLIATVIDAVAMVRGSTCMTKLRDLLEAGFPNIETLNIYIDPDIALTYGAASVIECIWRKAIRVNQTLKMPTITKTPPKTIN